MNPQQLERHARLTHIERAIEKIQSFAAGRTRVDYERDDLLASAIERQFTIIGEALHRALLVDETLARAISETDAIIALRNQLVHNYPRINPERIWSIIQKDLLREVRTLLAQPS